MYKLLPLLLLLAGCHRSWVTCRTEFLYPDYLASERVNTPDPNRYCFFGQQLIVHWRIPKSHFIRGVTLVLHLRYGDRSQNKIEIPLEKNTGWWVYRLLNQEYGSRGGILSFKAELIQDGDLLDRWTHFLWTDLIEINR
jgi:hypothetical protein